MAEQKGKNMKQFTSIILMFAFVVASMIYVFFCGYPF